ncbi:helix-turn-helix domain-containing protein [Aeromonas enterica]|jgi:AraC-like DNA-binding protein
MSTVYVVRNSILSEYERLVRKLSGNPQAYLKHFGITSAQLREPQGYLSHDLVCRLLEFTAKELNNPCFGFMFANIKSTILLGGLELAAFIQPTVEDAIEFIKPVYYLHANGTFLTSSSSHDRQRLALTYNFDKHNEYIHIYQLATQRIYNLLSARLSFDTTKLNVHLTQSAPASPSIPLNHIIFNSDFNGLSFPQSWLESEFSMDKESLTFFMTNHLNELKEVYPDNLLTMVSHTISTILPSGECSIEKVARSLDLHPRTLQLRLKEIGCNYNELLKECRLQIAINSLKEKDVNMTDIALNLGYSDVSTFSKNFKDWTGQSPSIWRKDQKT